MSRAKARTAISSIIFPPSPFLALAMRENPERKGVGNSILNGDGVFEEPNEVKSDELYIILSWL